MEGRVDYLRAKLPLIDAEIAAFSMQHSDYSVNWRHNYIVSVTTPRATGHVLHKVDAVSYPRISDFVVEKYKKWKKGEGDDALFRYFIEDERNQLLKVYKFTVEDDLAFFDEELDSGEIDVIEDGIFQGCNVVSIIYQSIRWWKTELSEISEKISENSIRRIDYHEN